MQKIIIDNVYSKIIGVLPDSVHAELNNKLAYRMDGYQYSKAYKAKKWDGIIRLYRRSYGQSFYTGLLAYVRDIFDQHNIEYERVDNRIRPEINLPHLRFTPPSHYVEREYQDFTVDRAIKFTRGVLCVATGGGKTLIVTKLIGQLKVYPFMFYVLTKDLMVQSHKVLSECLNEPIGMIGDGIAEVKKINVCTIQTAIRCLNFKNANFKISDYQYDDEDNWDEKAIEKVEDVEKIGNIIRAAKGVFLDECHHASASGCKEILTASSNAFWRFGGSATPYRDTGDEILIQAMFGSKIVDISASYLIENKHLVKPYILRVPISNKAKYSSYAKVYKACISHNVDFNNHVAEAARHLILRGKSVLVLVKTYDHGDYLLTQIPDSVFVTGRMTSKQREQSLQDLKDRKILCMIATSLADEGLDVPTLDAVILAGGGKSSTRINQRIGRTLRKDWQTGKSKDKSIVVLYEHDAKYLDKHAHKVFRIIKKEKAFEIIDCQGPDHVTTQIDKILGIDTGETDMFSG